MVCDHDWGKLHPSILYLTCFTPITEAAGAYPSAYRVKAGKPPLMSPSSTNKYIFRLWDKSWVPRNKCWNSIDSVDSTPDAGVIMCWFNKAVMSCTARCALVPAGISVNQWLLFDLSPQECRIAHPIVKCTYCRSEFQQERWDERRVQLFQIPRISRCLFAKTPVSCFTAKPIQSARNVPRTSNSLELWVSHHCTFVKTQNIEKIICVENNSGGRLCTKVF